MIERINYVPIDDMLRRVASSKEESDVTYFYDLLLLGEMVTKIVALFLVGNIKNDTERTRYRYEYDLVRANGIGDFCTTINTISTGNTSNLLPKEVQGKEILELTSRASKIKWAEEAIGKLYECMIMMEIETNPIPQRASLSLWFSLFAQLRNKTKGHGSPTSVKCSKAVLPLEKSVSLLIENFSAFKRDWVYLKQNISGSYRISIISGASVGFDYLKKKNNGAHLIDGVYCFTDSPRCIALINSDTELSHFSLPSGGFSNAKYEILDYVTDDKDFISNSDFLLPPSRLQASETEGRRKLTMKKNAYENIPADLDGYVSRSRLECELLDKLLDEDRFPIVTLKGRGGIGKTSLALHVVHELINRDRVDLISWFSARDIDLSSNGPKQVQATVINKEDIAKEYQRLISDSTPIVNSRDAIDVFTLELGQVNYGKALYIFDNFETLTNPAEIYEWLNNSIRMPNKILITSRLNISFKADYPIEVGGMEEDECRILISEVARRLSIEPLLTESYIQKLINESEGHPYIIKVILGEVAIRKKATDVKRIIADKDKILEALFRRTFSTLSSASKRVFLLLCSWPSMIPELALSSVLLREENEFMDVDKAIEELSKSSFIEIIEHDNEVFLSVPLAAMIYGKKELEVSADKLQIMKDRDLLMEFGADSKRGRLGLGPHIERKIKSVAARISSIGELEYEIPTLKRLAYRYPKAWIMISDLYQEYDDMDKAIDAYKEYLMSDIEESAKPAIWEKIIDICQIKGDWEGEGAAIASLVQNPFVSYEQISRSAKRINEYYYSHNVVDGVPKEIKQSFVESVIKVMEKRQSEADANDYSRLAWLYLNINNEVKALYYADKGLELSPGNSHCQRLHDRLSY